MSSFIANGETYESDDLVGSDGYGYNVPTVAGNGSTYPLAIAMMVDLVSDAVLNMITTSTSSVVVGTGSKTFILQSELPVVVGSFGFAYDNAAPTTNYIFFQVTSWTAGTKTMIVNGINSAGSGTLAAWDVVLHTGERGATGATGAAGVDGVDGDPEINGQTAITQLAQADEFVIYDDSAAGLKKISQEDIQKQSSLELRFFM